MLKLKDEGLHHYDHGQGALDGVSGDEPIYVVNFPQGFDNSRQPVPHARSVTPLRPYSVEAWLELGGMRDPQVRLVRSATVSAVPELAFRTEERERLTAVWVERAENDTQQSKTASARSSAANEWMGVATPPSRAAVVN